MISTCFYTGETFFLLLIFSIILTTYFYHYPMLP